MYMKKTLQKQVNELKGYIDENNFIDVSKIKNLGAITTNDYEGLYLAKYKDLLLVVQSIGNDQIFLLQILNYCIGQCSNVHNFRMNK